MNQTQRLSALFGKQSLVAEAAECTQATVSRWGDAVPHDRAVRLVRRAPQFGVNPNEVLNILLPTVEATVDALMAAHEEAAKEWSGRAPDEAAA